MVRLYWCPECRKFYTKVLVSGENIYSSHDGYYCVVDQKGDIQEESQASSEEEFDHAYILVECPEYHTIVDFKSDSPLYGHGDTIGRAESALEDYIVEIDDNGEIAYIGEKVESSEEELKQALATLV
jgi:hypothetical protein